MEVRIKIMIKESEEGDHVIEKYQEKLIMRKDEDIRQYLELKMEIQEKIEDFIKEIKEKILNEEEKEREFEIIEEKPCTKDGENGIDKEKAGNKEDNEGINVEGNIEMINERNNEASNEDRNSKEKRKREDNDESLENYERNKRSKMESKSYIKIWEEFERIEREGRIAVNSENRQEQTEEIVMLFKKAIAAEQK